MAKITVGNENDLPIQLHYEDLGLESQLYLFTDGRLAGDHGRNKCLLWWKQVIA